MNKKLIMGAIAATSCFAALAPIAKADPPAGSGWDKTPDVVVGGGSDTTYLVSQRLEVLFNGAPGCAVVTSGTSVNKGKCSDTTAAPTGPVNGNYDHDVFVSATPTGSGAGINALLPGGVQYNPPIDYARSSRVISSSPGGEADNETAWGYARDGIAVITFGTRSGVSLSKQDLIDIYTCTKTDWSQFGEPAGTIVPWDMNSSSGTYATFRTYLGNPTFGTCVQKLQATGLAPFENDVKPLLADKGFDAVYDTADDAENNYIWWISFGDWQKYPYTKNGLINGTGAPINSNLVTVDGTIPSNSSIGVTNTYAIPRTLYLVTRDLDADCRTTPNTAGPCNNAANTVYGATSGKAGAVRQFVQWLCYVGPAQHATNPVTGQNYRNEITQALGNEGFSPLASSIPGLRTAGYSCSVTTE